MTRFMYDSTSPAAIPMDAEMVAGYIDGLYGPVDPAGWTAAAWDRFPNATKVRIAVLPSTNDGHVLDVEAGNPALPNDAVDWVLMRRAAGADPSIYAGDGEQGYTVGEIIAAFNARGVPLPHFWLANYNLQQDVPDGYVAHQYADYLQLGTNYDLSAVADYWPGVDPAPQPDPQPIQPGSALNDIRSAQELYRQADALIESAAQDLTPVGA